MPAHGSVVRELGRLEMRRLARHPVFLIGVVANIVLLALELRTDFDYYNISIAPGFFVGLFSTVAMYRLSRSLETAQPALDSAPSAVRDRTLALCSATILPAIVGAVSLLAILLFMHPSEDLALGGLSAADRFAIFFGNTVIACIGGPLLGVAAGRWLRFPGGAAVLTVGLLFWVLLGEGMTSSDRAAGWTNAIRLSSPWTQFTSVESEKHELEVWRGSPWWYLGWIAALSVLALLGALLRNSEGEERRRIVRAGAVVGVVGLVCWALALVLGPDHALLFTRSGVHQL
jgi:hypothetical protein